MIGAILHNPSPTANASSLEEFTLLINAAGFTVSHVFSQKSDKNDSVTYFGKGKLYEIREFYQNSLQNVPEFPKFDCLIVNDDISALQKRSLEQIIGIPVFDRTLIILRIFELNAKSKEAILQVEIAKLEYTSNQLINSFANYSQVTSGSGKNKGEGEKEIELSKRQIERKIFLKKKELESIKLSRRTSRKQRNKLIAPKIAVVGYTNAGKSTLINALIKYQGSHPNKNVYVKDDVFATLETATRYISIFGYPAFFITDTVGFISHLPVCLVDAFRSTLEEIVEADLIVEVVDFSSPEYREHIKTTNDVLAQIGCKDIPLLYLLNKFDKVTNRPTSLPNGNEIYTCLTEDDESIIEILQFISSFIAFGWEKCEVIFPYQDDFYRFMADNYVVSYKEKDDGYHCLVYLNPQTRYRYAYLFN